jgi:hypothetical protein
MPLVAYSSGFGPLSGEHVSALGYIIGHRQRLLKSVAKTGDYYPERLTQVRFKKPASVCIARLAIGVDFGDEGYASKVQAKCRREGLLAANEGASLVLLLALNIEEEARCVAWSFLDDAYEVVFDVGSSIFAAQTRTSDDFGLGEYLEFFKPPQRGAKRRAVGASCLSVGLNLILQWGH